MNLDWKDLLEIYENTHDEETKAQLWQVIKDAPPGILPQIKLKPDIDEKDAVKLWLENLKQMKEG